jgi:outer membrane usher protein
MTFRRVVSPGGVVFLLFFPITVEANGGAGLAAAIPAADAAVYESDDLLAKVFGDSYNQKSASLELDISLDGEKVGEAVTLVGRECKIHAHSLAKILENYLISEATKQIIKLADADGFISLKNLGLLKISAKFNRQLLLVELSAPIEKKKVRSLGKGRFYNVAQTPDIRQAMVSGSVDTRISEAYYHGRVTYQRRSLIFSPVLNIGGLVFEGEIARDYFSDFQKNKGFRREYSSAVYDWAEKDLFFRVGDIFSNFTKYQNVPRLFGAQIKKETPRHLEYRQAQVRQITLLRKSTIKVYCNGNLVKVKEGVAPGTYELDDISYSSGNNDVKIKIIDDAGREQDLEESFFLETSFVPQGKFDIDCSFGYPEVNDPKKGRYDKQNRIISIIAKYGLLNATEIEGGMEDGDHGVSCAAAIKNKNPCGNFELRYARSKHQINADTASGFKLAGNAYYLYYSTPSISLFEKSMFNAGFSFEQLDSFFHPYLSSSMAVNPDNFLSVRENAKGKSKIIGCFASFDNLFALNFSSRYRIRTDQKHRRSQSFFLNLSKSVWFGGAIFNSANFNASFERSKNFNGQINRSFCLGCTVYLKNDMRLSSGYVNNSNGNSAHVTMSKSPHGSDRISYDLSAFRNSRKDGFSLDSFYLHPMFKVEFNHAKYDDSSNSTRAAIETALFFADGNFAIARKTSSDGGFIMATPRKAMKDETIKFANSGVASDIFGNAVLPLSRNYVTTARLDLRDVPDTLNVEPNTLVAVGQYRRGALVEISAEGSYVAEGDLYNQNGNPLKLVSGCARHCSDRQAKPSPFFTDSAGKFIIMGLSPGKYKASVNVEGVRDFEFNVIETGQHTLKLGKVFCQNAEVES